MRIVVCGGGNVGHAIIGKLSQLNDVHVSLLTSSVNRWSSKIEIYENDGVSNFSGEITIADNPADIISEADIVILTTPSFLNKEILLKIEPFLSNNTWVGSIQCAGGFFWEANNILGDKIKIFGFERVPYISRIKDYGKSVYLKGYKSELHIALLKDYSQSDIFLSNIESLFNVRTILLKSYLNVTLTNSNPILHPSRLYDLFKDWTTGMFYEKEPLFYEEWTDCASKNLIKCDNELNKIVRKMSNAMEPITSIKEHYGVKDYIELTKKLNTIEAFKGIKLSMIKHKDGYIPDVSNRYFVEDITNGLLLIRGCAELVNVETPMISEIIIWAQTLMNKEYLLNGKLTGKDISETAIPQKFGINNISDLIEFSLN